MTPWQDQLKHGLKRVVIESKSAEQTLSILSEEITHPVASRIAEIELDKLRYLRKSNRIKYRKIISNIKEW